MSSPDFLRQESPAEASVRVALRFAAASLVVGALLLGGHLTHPTKDTEPAPVAPVTPVVQQASTYDDSPLAQAEVAGKISREYGIDYERTMRIVSKAYEQAKLNDLNPVMVLSVIATESSFKEHAMSRAGAVGLMQVMPKVHKDMVKKIGANLGVGNLSPRDILTHWEANIEAGVKVLKTYSDRSHGDLRETLLRYNGSLHLENSPYADRVTTKMRWIAASLPPGNPRKL